MTLFVLTNLTNVIRKMSLLEEVMSFSNIVFVHLLHNGACPFHMVPFYCCKQLQSQQMKFKIIQ